MVDSSDTLDFRSASKPSKRYRAHLARYGLSKGTTAHLPRLSYSHLLLNAGEVLPVETWQYWNVYGNPPEHKRGTSALEGETPGNARRTFRKLALRTNKSKMKARYVCWCKICCPGSARTAEVRKQGKRDVAGLQRCPSSVVDDRNVCYADVNVSLWDEGILEQDFYEEDGGGLWGGDWSGAVDLAERKWMDKCQGLSVSVSPSISPGDTPRTMPRTPGWGPADEWVLCEDDFLAYSSDEWEVL